MNTLIIDTPPGTGDVHLSLVQNVPIRGSLVVTTSHPLALSDTRRGIEMLLKLNVMFRLLCNLNLLSFMICRFLCLESLKICPTLSAIIVNRHQIFGELRARLS